MKGSDREQNLNEQAIDQFIDDLVADKAPGVYGSGPVDPELEEMLETVRALRRHTGSSGQRSKTGDNRWWKGLSALAAAVLLFVLGSTILNLPWVENTFLRGWSGHLPGNTVEAAVRAYEELRSYSGIFEIRIEQNGEVRYLETVAIQYEKPNRYTAVHRFNGYEQRYTSNGERLVARDHSGVTVDYLFPEKNLWRYHIGTVIRELAEAEKVEVTDNERIFDREAELLTYRYPGSEGGEFSQVWIDSATFLPLRKVFHHSDGSTLVVEFTELVVNSPIDPAVFEISEGPEGVGLNRLGRLDQVIAAWPEIETILPAILKEMRLWKTGLLDHDLFEYVLRFQGDQEGDFLDLYYTSKPAQFYFYRKSKVGLLGKGCLEINPSAWNVFERYAGSRRMARWVTEEHEVFIVTNRGTDFLQSLLEMLAGEEMQLKNVQEMIDLGYEPVVEKEGH